MTQPGQVRRPARVAPAGRVGPQAPIRAPTPRTPVRALRTTTVAPSARRTATTSTPAVASDTNPTETDQNRERSTGETQDTAARMMAVVKAMRTRTPAPPRPAPEPARPAPDPQRTEERPLPPEERFLPVHVPRARRYASSWRQRRPWLIVGALVLIGLAVRVVLMRSIWVDEAISIHQAHMSLGGMLDNLRATDRHPPLHYLILWLIVRLL